MEVRLLLRIGSRFGMPIFDSLIPEGSSAPDAYATTTLLDTNSATPLIIMSV